jgi:hypothetical protein
MRRLRIHTSQRQLAALAARRIRNLLIMRCSALVAICATATIVLNDGVNQRWSTLVLGTSSLPTAAVRPAMIASGTLSPAIAPTIAAQSPAESSPVRLGTIEIDDSEDRPQAIPVKLSRPTPFAVESFESESHAPPASIETRCPVRAAMDLGREAGQFGIH